MLPSAPAVHHMISGCAFVGMTASLAARLSPHLHLVHRLTSASIHMTSVRWKRREPIRKHIWLPQAPSKLFKIPEKVYLPRDEQQQMDHLRFNYDADMLSISSYCREHFYLPSREAGGLTAEQVQAEEEQHKRRLLENENENRRIAAERQKRVTEQKQKLQQELVQQEMEHKRQQEQNRIQAEQVIRSEIERSATFITKENLLSAIEDALLHSVSYDFAIDRNGNVITDGTIHVMAFTPSAVPQSSDNSKTMMDATGSKLATTKLY